MVYLKCGYTTVNAFGVALLSSAVHRTIPAARSADAACGGAITEKRIFSALPHREALILLDYGASR